MLKKRRLEGKSDDTQDVKPNAPPVAKNDGFTDADVHEMTRAEEKDLGDIIQQINSKWNSTDNNSGNTHEASRLVEEFEKMSFSVENPLNSKSLLNENRANAFFMRELYANPFHLLPEKLVENIRWLRMISETEVALRPLMNTTVAKKRALPFKFYVDALLPRHGLMVYSIKRIFFSATPLDTAVSQATPNSLHLECCFFDYNDAGFGGTTDSAQIMQKKRLNKSLIRAEALALHDDSEASIPLDRLSSWVCDMLRVQVILMPVEESREQFGSLDKLEFDAHLQKFFYKFVVYYYTKN